MLDWFELTNVHVEIKDDTKLVHIYLDENELTINELTRRKNRPPPQWLL